MKKFRMLSVIACCMSFAAIDLPCARGGQAEEISTQSNEQTQNEELTGKFKDSESNVREKPDSKSKLLFVSGLGDEFKVLERYGEKWFKVQLKDGRTGWTSIINIQLDKNNYAVVSSKSGLSLRDEPSTKGKKIDLIKSGTRVEILEKTNRVDTIDDISSAWFKIKFGEIEGYVFGGFLEMANLEQEALLNQGENDKVIVESASAKLATEELKKNESEKAVLALEQVSLQKEREEKARLLEIARLIELEKEKLRQEKAFLASERANLQKEREQMGKDANKVSEETSEIVQQAKDEKERLEEEKARVEEEKARLEEEKARLEEEKARVEEEKARLEEEKARIEKQNKQQQIRAELERRRNEAEEVARRLGTYTGIVAASKKLSSAQLSESLVGTKVTWEGWVYTYSSGYIGQRKCEIDMENRSPTTGHVVFAIQDKDVEHGWFIKAGAIAVGNRIRFTGTIESVSVGFMGGVTIYLKEVTSLSKRE